MSIKNGSGSSVSSIRASTSGIKSVGGGATAYAASILVIGGGGNGSSNGERSGGGGAGGMLSVSNFALQKGGE